MIIPFIPGLTRFANHFFKLSLVKECKVHNGKYVAVLLPYNVWYVTAKCENESQANRIVKCLQSCIVEEWFYE